jgi:ABC-2 type transport system ATP-binding protein
VIEVRNLTKRFGDTVAVDDLSFTVQPGLVTGFLGPNGAGKTTTMRVILGLDRADSGTALVNGRAYASLPDPLSEVGTLLDAKDVHGGRTARSHLLALAQSNGLPARRVDEVLDLTGMSSVAKKRIKGFSLGMSQRLGIAAALLGDPGVLMFDEPVNGLDPEGVLWIRHLLRSLAREGRTIFVSSHLMSEMALTADHLIVIGRGRLIADVAVADFTKHASSDLVYIRTPEAERLRNLLVGPTVHVTAVSPGRLEVIGLTSDEIGDLAAANMIPLHELIPHQASLEDAFMSLTHDAVEFQTTDVSS